MNKPKNCDDYCGQLRFVSAQRARKLRKHVLVFVHSRSREYPSGHKKLFAWIKPRVGC